MDEVKIAPCPYCGQQGVKNSSGHTVHSPDLNFHHCRLFKVMMLLDQWNALCALIDKGRDYDSAVRQLTSLYDNLHGEHLETRQHLNTAVRLLGPFVQAGIDFHSIPQLAEEDMFLWKPSHGQGITLRDCGDAQRFLALDAIKTILKQKGQ